MVYDSVGKDTFLKSLDCLQPRGLHGALRQFVGPGRRAQHGAARRQGLALRDPPHARGYAAKREELVAAANELFDHVKAGRIKVGPRQRYALKDAAQAHRDLEARQDRPGSTILVP